MRHTHFEAQKCVPLIPLIVPLLGNEDQQTVKIKALIPVDQKSNIESSFDLRNSLNPESRWFDTLFYQTLFQQLQNPNFSIPKIMYHD